MKREVICSGCIPAWEKIGRQCERGKWPGEGVHMVYGDTVVSCRCDGCGSHIESGASVACVSNYTWEHKYFPWEGEFLSSQRTTKTFGLKP